MLMDRWTDWSTQIFFLLMLPTKSYSQAPALSVALTEVSLNFLPGRITPSLSSQGSCHQDLGREHSLLILIPAESPHPQVSFQEPPRRAFSLRTSIFGPRDAGRLSQTERGRLITWRVTGISRLFKAINCCLKAVYFLTSRANLI